MMKWKVVKNPRSASADRSLECLRQEVQLVPHPSSHAWCSDSNNNEEDRPPNKDTPRHRDSSSVRKHSLLTTECINLKSFLGLTRQRSETNLSCLGLICSGGDTRRSRSEVRGVSCDRLALGYGHQPGHTRSSSPHSSSRPGWLRGRKRERESRNHTSKNTGPEVPGKTVVTGSHRKRTGSKSQKGRTIVDGSVKGRPHQSKKSKKSADVIEEEIYAEILPEEPAHHPRKEPVAKVIRKKGLAPKPQIATELFRDDVTLDPNGRRGSPTSLDETRCAPPVRRPPPRRNPAPGTRSASLQPSRLNHPGNEGEDTTARAKNDPNAAQSVVAVAEIHGEMPATQPNEVAAEPPIPAVEDDNLLKSLLTPEELGQDAPFDIDTPDYSTLDSVDCHSFSTEDSNVLDSQGDGDGADLSGIPHDAVTETDPDSKKTVRFERLDLIETYQRHKTDVAEDTDASDASPSMTMLDVNSNEVEAFSEDISQSSADGLDPVEDDADPLIVHVRGPSSPGPFVVKKSFVLTLAKQENGFRSLCAHKKPEPPPPDPRISVTFHCSAPAGRSTDERQRVRSTSVPPQQPVEGAAKTPAPPALRCRSRERKSKDRQHCRKNHKARKKDAVFVMPQAVIDELSQVLEKRNPERPLRP